MAILITYESVIRSCALMLCLSSAALYAQRPTRLEFDVASIKRNVDGSGLLTGGSCLGDDSHAKATEPVPRGGNSVASPSIAPGTCRFGKTTLREIIAAAYGIPRGEFERVILGGPEWLDQDLFNIEAKADSIRPQGEVEQMLQMLLADRFSLRLRRETRALEGYALTAAADRGANLMASTLVAPGVRPKWDGANVTIAAVATSMSKLATFLSNHLERPIIDKTGLHGGYDFSLSWTMGLGERSLLERLNLPGRPPQPSGDARTGPSLFTALREQLGLRLEATRVPTEVLIVDQVAPLSAN